MTMIGRAPAFAAMLERVDRISACDATVLLEGETGTGKELVAREIHYRSGRRDGPFVPVHCGALPEALIENELFGHARGAFTDARSAQPGLVELARGGTLFLDEIDTASHRTQVTFLRFLQDCRFRPLGGGEERRADVRIIAASNQDLASLAGTNAFRLDLFYRLRLLHLVLPPLRERPGDPTLLAEHFVEVASERFGGPPRPLDPATLSWFEAYRWPGNVRELEHRVYRAFLEGDSGPVRAAPPEGVVAPDEAAPSMTYADAKARAVRAFERRFLSRAIQRANGNISAAARMIGTERRHLGRLLKKHGIEIPRGS
jgi:DNA-binding NtrC family response regulator